MHSPTSTSPNKARTLDLCSRASDILALRTRPPGDQRGPRVSNTFSASAFAISSSPLMELASQSRAHHTQHCPRWAHHPQIRTRRGVLQRRFGMTLLRPQRLPGRCCIAYTLHTFCRRGTHALLNSALSYSSLLFFRAHCFSHHAMLFSARFLPPFLDPGSGISSIARIVLKLSGRVSCGSDSASPDHVWF